MAITVLNNLDELEEIRLMIGSPDCFYIIKPSAISFYKITRDVYAFTVDYVKKWISEKQEEKMSGRIQFRFQNKEISYTVQDNFSFRRKPKTYQRIIENHIEEIFMFVHDLLIRLYDNMTINNHQLEALRIIEEQIVGVYGAF